MYADQGSGLGGEKVSMEVGGRDIIESTTAGSDRREREEGKVGRWMELVEEWEKNGKKGNGPPGTRENEIYVTSAAARERDYVLLRTGYSLNSEVSLFSFLYLGTWFNFQQIAD